MSLQASDLLKAEITTLQKLLSELDEDAVIERHGLKRRLASAQTQLASLPHLPQPKSLPITFRGDPVDGSRSINAAFAATALKVFIEVTETVAASRESARELKGSGRLPGRRVEHGLRLVGTATGSFGLALELPPDAQSTLPEPLAPSRHYEQAIHDTFALIQGAAAHDDDALAALVAQLHPRASSKVHEFMKVLQTNRALFAAEFEGRQVRLDSEDEVQRALDSLKPEDISEREFAQRGVLVGVLPSTRDFECRLGTGEVMQGKLAREIDDIMVFKARWEGVEAQLMLRSSAVRKRERFVLLDATALDDAPIADSDRG